MRPHGKLQMRLLLLLLLLLLSAAAAALVVLIWKASVQLWCKLAEAVLLLLPEALWATTSERGERILSLRRPDRRRRRRASGCI